MLVIRLIDAQSIQFVFIVGQTQVIDVVILKSKSSPNYVSNPQKS